MLKEPYVQYNNNNFHKITKTAGKLTNACKNSMQAMLLRTRRFLGRIYFVSFYQWENMTRSLLERLNKCCGEIGEEGGKERSKEKQGIRETMDRICNFRRYLSMHIYAYAKGSFNIIFSKEWNTCR